MSAATAENHEAERPVELFFLEELQFDLRNPRYGAGAARLNTEREALDHIVEMFGVNDVLSSIAVNGFFDSEPLVGIKLENDDRVKVLEGNRRLAACLIWRGTTGCRSSSFARTLQCYSQGEWQQADHADPCHRRQKGKDALKEVLPYIVYGTLSDF